MIGRKVSHYEILDELASGGMGIVYRARDLKLGRMAALKFIHPHLLGEDAGTTERFIAEARAASSIDHPNIATIYEIGETDDGRLFIAMAYYDAEPLSALCDGRKLSIEQATDLAAQIAAGLAAAHAARIVHRDIKPANILVDASGTAKIIDFGIAKLADNSMRTQTGHFLGTIAYMAPEQLHGEPADERTDVWALGVVLQEMLTGELPFAGKTPAALTNSILNEEPRLPGELRDDVPPPLDAVVARCLAKAREERFSSAAEVQDALIGAVGSPDIVARGRGPGRIVAAAVLLIALMGIVGLLLQRSRVTWARTEAIPQIQRLAEEQDYRAAFEVAEEAERYLADDPTLEELWLRIARPASVQTEPSGADVYVREYHDRDGEWVHLGQTPLEGLRIPQGAKRWRLEMAGYTVRERSTGLFHEIVDTLRLVGADPEGMVHVPGGFGTLRLTGIEPGPRPELESFWIDVHEVTNSAFLQFVDQGGYQSPEYWAGLLPPEEPSLTWERLTAGLRDPTGRPGPATWELGRYPEGTADYPVTGVSWYEAAAYCQSLGKRLPTVFHWQWISGHMAQMGADITAVSNHNTGALSPVGSYDGAGPWGTFDTAGNAKEWMWNGWAGQRYLLGGSYDTPSYFFNHAETLDPLDREPRNGFRCALYSEDPVGEAWAPLEFMTRDYLSETPVGDEVFEIYKTRFDYDRDIPFDESIDEIDTSDNLWSVEKVSINTAYGERMQVVLFMPKGIEQPYQPVLFWPGSNAATTGSVDEGIPSEMGWNHFDFIMRSGRAVVWPIYDNTYSRGGGETDSWLAVTWPTGTNEYVERLVRWVKDLRRAVDYIETRPEFDTSRIGFYGTSWGGRMAAIVPAVEDRITVAIAYAGGLPAANPRPEVDPFNYVTRVTIPVLMLNGTHDAVEDYERAQIPMYRLLGSPAEDKDHRTFPTGHAMPRNDVIQVAVDWLDKYMGPTARRSGEGR